MHRPRIKSVFPPFPIGDGLIRIGGVDYGTAAELQDDAQGHLWHLLGLLDGTRTTQELVAAMQQYDPLVPAADVEETLAVLIENGYLEDAQQQPAPESFSAAEVERYRRNFEFFSYFNVPPFNSYEVQERLKRARVTVLGLGGLGSFVALSLAAAGVGDLLLVDDDTVELCNLNRQVLYTDDDLGRSKCEAAVKRLTQVNPHIQVHACQVHVSGVEEARACFAGRDLLICAADRPRIRLYEWLNAAAVAEGVAWLRGANDGMTVNLFLHVPGKTACFECEQIRAYEQHPWYQRYIQYAMEVIGDRTINPCTAPVAGLIGNFAALEAVKYLTGVVQPAVYDRKLVFDLRAMEIFYVPGERMPNCPACGAGRPAEVVGQ